MSKSSRILLFLFSLLFLILVPGLVSAQNSPGDPCVDPNLYCPVDGGLGFLIAAGIGYGVKKVRDAQKKETSSL